MRASYFEEIARQERSRMCLENQCKARKYGHVPKELHDIIMREVDGLEDEKEARRKFKELCPKGLRHLYYLKFTPSRWKSAIPRMVVNRRKSPISLRHHKKQLRHLWVTGQDYHAYVKEWALRRAWVDSLIAEWKAEDTIQKQNILRVERQALERAIEMKLTEMTVLIETVLDRIEEGLENVNLEEISPKSLQALTACAKDLQTIRNLEEGRPTALHGKVKLTREGLVERLEKLRAKGVPLELPAEVLKALDDKNPQ